MMQTIYFGAGCFWGVQYYFDQVPGVKETEVGYTGGHTDNPTYEAVCSHTTGHAEAVRIVYDPSEVASETLLRQFFYMHDPTQLNRQGPDIGDSYRSAIFYESDEQRHVAETVLNELNTNEYDGRIVTEIAEVGAWWPAEEYHQKFTERTGRGMCHAPFRPM